MTDDSNLTPGGEMNSSLVNIEMKSDDEGYLIQWTKADSSGTLGPFNDKEVALRAMEAKRRELIVNETPL